jgi:hypothetical protein
MKNVKRLVSWGLIAVVLFVSTGMTAWESASVTLFLYTFYQFMHSIGRRIAILEMWAFVAGLELLLMPCITYSVLPDAMPLESDPYLAFAFTGTLGFLLGLKYTVFSTTLSHLDYIERVKDYLKDKEQIGIALIGIGVIGYIAYTVAPLSIKSLFAVISNCANIGVIYIYYSKSRYRVMAMGVAIGALFLKTVQEGMFGDLVFWLLLWILMFTMGRKWVLSVGLKLSFVVFGFMALLLLQSIKFEYRQNTWGGSREERNGDAGLMLDLVVDRLANPEKLFDIVPIYSSFTRFNQGITMGNAMTYVPEHEPYANGEVLLALTYPFIPRLLWKDKPITGGEDTIRRFTNLPIFKNNSINITPLGEGYVNFGYWGAFVFIFFFGLLFNCCFHWVLIKSEQLPTLVLWLPSFFARSLTFETDLYTTWGSLVQAALFAWIFYQIAAYFKIKV